MLGDDYWTDAHGVVHILSPETHEPMCGEEHDDVEGRKHRVQGCSGCVIEVSCALGRQGHVL